MLSITHPVAALEANAIMATLVALRLFTASNAVAFMGMLKAMVGRKAISTHSSMAALQQRQTSLEGLSGS
jgi:hypothetical protein